MKRIAALLTALALLPLGGCAARGGIAAGYRAIEDLQLVRTLGADADGDAVVLSAAAGRVRDDAPVILRAGAGGLAAGLDALQAQTPRGSLFFAHTQYLVLGRRYAAGGIGEILDFVERDIHMRMGAALFVLRDGPAQALVCGAGDGWDVNDVLASVRTETNLHGDSHVFDVRETAVALSEYGAALICALRTADTEGTVFALPPGRAAVPDGYGILRGGVLVGFLDGAQARAASLMRGLLGTVTMEAASGVALELSAPPPELRVLPGADGALRLDVRVAPEAVLVSPGAAQGTVMDEAALQALTTALNSAIEAELQALFDRVRTENADFLALGRAARRCGVDPAALPPDWLQTLDVRITVDTCLRHSYDLGERAGTDGGGRL